MTMDWLKLYEEVSPGAGLRVAYSLPLSDCTMDTPSRLTFPIDHRCSKWFLNQTQGKNIVARIDVDGTRWTGRLVSWQTRKDDDVYRLQTNWRDQTT